MPADDIIGGTSWIGLPQLASQLGLDRRTVEPLLGRLGYEPVLGKKRKRYLLPPEVLDEIRGLLKSERDPLPDHRPSHRFPESKKRARDRSRPIHQPLSGEWWKDV